MINISGISESRVAPVSAYLAKEKNQSIIIVSTDVRAKRLALDLSFFVRDKEIIVLPSEEQFLAEICGKRSRFAHTKIKSLKSPAHRKTGCGDCACFGCH